MEDLPRQRSGLARSPKEAVSVAEASGNGRSFVVTSVITPKVPQEPIISLDRVVSGYVSSRSSRRRQPRVAIG